MPIGRSLLVENGPEDSSTLLVRPELLHLWPLPGETFAPSKTFAPGDALCDLINSAWAVRVAAEARRVGLGTGEASQRCVVYRQLGGDSISVASDALVLARRWPQSACYRVVFTFHTPEAWIPWGKPFLHALVQMFHSSANHVLNGPVYRFLRVLDAQFYQVLSMRTFNRGPPMIPISESDGLDEAVHVSAGAQLGLVSWARFKPHEKFHLSEYLQSFMQLLGHKVKTYDTLDGQKLVPYQCVVVRHEWDQLRASFLKAFRVQKTAYRRRNGGSSTPSLVEDARPHLISSDLSKLGQQLHQSHHPEVTTFFV
eukprot:Skav206204  [mRNA]  locus=scaffold1844:397256:399845:- [translate_table: standard]